MDITFLWIKEFHLPREDLLDTPFNIVISIIKKYEEWNKEQEKEAKKITDSMNSKARF